MPVSAYVKLGRGAGGSRVCGRSPAGWKRRAGSLRIRRASVGSEGAGSGGGPLLRGPPHEHLDVGADEVSGENRTRRAGVVEDVRTRGGRPFLTPAVPILAGGGCHGHAAAPTFSAWEI